MAETVSLWLKANGAAINGQPTQVSLGREDSIECLYYEGELISAREAGSGMATGRRQHRPVMIRKRIDKATPLILNAMCKNETIDAVFKFYRPNPNGDGTTEQFFTVEITQGRVANHRLYNPDTIVPASSTMPGMEEVSFVFNSISWTIEDGGVSAEDSWSKSA